MELRYCEECGDIIKADTADAAGSAPGRFICDACRTGSPNESIPSPSDASPSLSFGSTATPPPAAPSSAPNPLDLFADDDDDLPPTAGDADDAPLRLIEEDDHAIEPPPELATGDKITFPCVHCSSTLSVRRVTKASRLTCPYCEKYVYLTRDGRFLKDAPSVIGGASFDVVSSDRPVAAPSTTGSWLDEVDDGPAGAIVEEVPARPSSPAPPKRSDRPALKKPRLEDLDFGGAGSFRAPPPGPGAGPSGPSASPPSPSPSRPTPREAPREAPPPSGRSPSSRDSQSRRGGSIRSTTSSFYSRPPSTESFRSASRAAGESFRAASRAAGESFRSTSRAERAGPRREEFRPPSDSARSIPAASPRASRPSSLQGGGGAPVAASALRRSFASRSVESRGPKTRTPALAARDRGRAGGSGYSRWGMDARRTLGALILAILLSLPFLVFAGVSHLLDGRKATETETDVLFVSIGAIVQSGLAPRATPAPDPTATGDTRDASSPPAEDGLTGSPSE